MKIVRDGKIIDDDIRHLGDEEAPGGDRFTVSFARWKSQRETLLSTGKCCGVRLFGDNPVDDISSDLPHLHLIVLEFGAMADGRGFSQARLLRQRFGYGGEIRARGNFIRDQVYFLARVGVNGFDPAEGTSLESLLPALADFTVNYQAAGDGRGPLYRRRG